MSLEETAKLKEEARIEEENLQKAKEIAECAADAAELIDGDGEEPAEDPPAEDEGAEGEGESEEGAPGDSVPHAPAEDAPAEKIVHAVPNACLEPGINADTA
ncbi:hypothetical protein CYMTET_7233 [Cymbomonas tetramitiformis]|uniref:Uncharacterized protein n=1 Tax=Cymbomonas tetramitiformis TaxID=36881 RepID=A0AAE0GVE5_9CHLO|nr:hypothetical protein CYMTET_7233 [Cymbomonas tetramitiformis]